MTEAVEQLPGTGQTSELPPGKLPPAGQSGAADRIMVATQWQLTWWRFRKHRLAMVAAVLIIFFYLIVLFAEFFAYSDTKFSNEELSLLPPQPIHWFDEGEFRPYVHPVVGKRDPKTFKKVYKPDLETKATVVFWAEGFEYKLWGLIPTNRHLLGVEGLPAEESLFILGTDLQGRDLFSRLMIATRTSLTIGLVGVILSLFLGVLLGGISGLYGGAVDNVIQRFIEIVRSIPTIPLWMGLAAAMPPTWPITRIYFFITIIISLIGWTVMARCAWTLSFLAHRRFYYSCGIGRCRPTAHYLPPHGALFPQPHHCRGYPCYSRYDYFGDIAELSRLRLASTGSQLGRAFATGPKCAGCCDFALAAHSRRTGDFGNSGFQFFG
ncbi:MAG: hypothetical protein R2932_32395 [Caldilineaceae bacterium]